MKRHLGPLFGLVLLVAGCDLGEVTGGDAAQSMAIARSFLAALEAGDASAAWSLIYPPNRDERFVDFDAFEAVARRIDLANVEWDVIGAREHDGHWHVDLRLVPLEVAPPLDTFVQVVTTNGVQSGTAIQVDIDPLGGARGVLGG